METLDALLARREGIEADIDSLIETTTVEDYEPTEDDMTRLSGLREAKAKTDKLVEAAEARRESRRRAPVRQPLSAPGDDPDDRIEVGEPGFMRDPKRGFRHAGDFAVAVAYAAINPGRGLDQRLAAITGMSQSTGSDGGFLVPPAFATEIWSELSQASDNILGRTDQFTVTGELLTLNAVGETSRATGSRYGGVQGYWIAEADQITSSKPKLRQIKLEPQQVAVLIYATDKLINNAVALNQFLTRAAVDEINFLVGDSIFNGDGAGKPRGIIGAAGTIDVAKETGQAAATIKVQNIIKMWSRLHARARRNAVWFYNQDIEPQLFTMTLDVGTGGVPVFMPPGGISGAPFATIWNRPAIAVEYCSTLGTSGDIVLADMMAYASGVRGGIDAAASMHLRFDFAETAFRFMFEVDGQPWIASAITPFKGTNTLSPFVTLATRA